ncbi:hypothetical protein ABZ297_40860 [Nonomuraea sp. NPDC005983]|uniref:hypothetical protein n=1 Tax=Nonomuraea sp. NPDC005983 TaxID=3155595 RepID=UPI0033BCE5E8
MSIKTDKLARMLGMVSLALGTAQLTAPKSVSRLSGVGDSRLARETTRLAGARQLMHAATLLGSRRPGPWVWSRGARGAKSTAHHGKSQAALPHPHTPRSARSQIRKTTGWGK